MRQYIYQFFSTAWRFPTLYSSTTSLRLTVFCLILIQAPFADCRTALTMKNYQTIGEASLRVALFRIYDARLSSPSGMLEPDREPLLLTLKYNRSISREKLVEETRDQLMGKIGTTNLSKVSAYLEKIWPDVNKGDVISFLLTPNGNGTFYFNGEPLGAVPDPEFNRAFINIWLGQNSSYPKLASKLRGES